MTLLSGFEWKARTFALGDIAADNDSEIDMLVNLPAGYKYQISNGYISADVSLSTEASNIQTITIKTGGGTCLWFYSNKTTTGSAITQGKPTDLVMIPGEILIDCVAAATTLEAHYVTAASGSAISKCVIQMDIVPELV